MSFRIRVKVFIQPSTQRMYMVGMGQLDRVTGVMRAFAMRDDETIPIVLTCDQWNALPYRYFEDAGPAPKPAEVVDVDNPSGPRFVELNQKGKQ